MRAKIERLLRKGILLSPDLVEKTDEEIEKLIETQKETPQEKHAPIEEEQEVEILESFEEKNTKISIKDFVNLYNSRFLALQSILRHRQELEGATAIRKIHSMQDKETTSFIGMVSSIITTKNNHIMLTLEDQTGTIKAVISKNNKEALTLAKEITLDEIIGIQGTKGDKIVFVNTIIFPDVPLTKELKKSQKEEAAVFISDLHIGAKEFLKKKFEKFIEWINGNIGTDQQREQVKKIKYLFIVGDIVDGIGIYPEQEKDLEIKDIYEQYSIFSDFIKKIPNHINIIISPGNHDTLRIAEPQPTIPKEFVLDLYNQKNIYFISNPAYVRIGRTKKFLGYDILIYHGFSFPFYADTIESIRTKGGMENTENIMAFLLKKRHLAPTHGSTQYQLGYDKDPLVITNVPDFFVTGHVHRAAVKNYRNITMLNCACWISQTEYQEKRGLVPQPCRAIYVDMKTRETKILNFSDK